RTMTSAPALAAASDDMRITDLLQVAEIERKSFLDPWSLNAFVAEFLNGRSSRRVVRAGQPPRVVAFGIFWTAGDELHINNVAVHRHARRQGHAERLIADALERARRADLAEAFLEVRASNQAARRLYGKLGFREVARRRAYYSNNGEDALVLRLDLGTRAPR